MNNWNLGYGDPPGLSAFPLHGFQSRVHLPAAWLRCSITFNACSWLSASSCFTSCVSKNKTVLCLVTMFFAFYKSLHSMQTIYCIRVWECILNICISTQEAWPLFPKAPLWRAAGSPGSLCRVSLSRQIMCKRGLYYFKRGISERACLGC